MLSSEIKINLVQLLLNLSRSLDFSRQGITDHHKRVALMSLQFGKAAGLMEKELDTLFQAAIIHDAGAATWEEKSSLEQFDINNPWDHCHRGYQLVSDLNIIGPAANIILSHHDRWEGENPSGLRGDNIPLTSRIIHLADRIDVLLKPGSFILDQQKEVTRAIQALAGSVFDPGLVALFYDLSKGESFWLDLDSFWLNTHLNLLIPTKEIQLELADVLGVGKLFGRIVDSKSRFTYRHSNGVASVANFLGCRLGLAKENCVLLSLAGMLHDLGKLAIPEEIIEKPGKLNDEEFRWIKQHPYYTYWLLKTVAPQLSLAEWAAYHHERLDGRGYPFRKRDNEIDILARIIAVADIFTALREERPYRGSLNWLEIGRIMISLVADGAIDAGVVDVLFNSKSELDDIWLEISSRFSSL